MAKKRAKEAEAPKEFSEKYWKLWAEYKFRQKMIWRLYPDARIRNAQGGGCWDAGQPSVILVVLNDTADGVIYDHEMTVLMRAIEKENLSMIGKIEWDPESIAVRMRMLGILFSAAATSDETWTEEVKAAWKKACSPE